ncbi:MAG: hypothetical protein WC942_07575 [Clostridia bacterium]
MLFKILIDANKAPKTLKYKWNKSLITLADEEEACKNPQWAYWFALSVPGADIEKCQEAACQDPFYAYFFALNIPGADIKNARRQLVKILVLHIILL